MWLASFKQTISVSARNLNGQVAYTENDTVLSPPGGAGSRGFALSHPEEIHAYILECMKPLCLKAFPSSFKTFY